MSTVERLNRTEARLRHGKECHEEVTRKGQVEPCDSSAVALRYWAESDTYYPVCTRHARGFCLPLVDPDDAAALVAAIRTVLILCAEMDTHGTTAEVLVADTFFNAIEEALA